MPCFLAIDAGGTQTRCVLADEQQILARASAGSIKLQRVGEAEATARLAALLDEVSAAAHVALPQITRTCIGLAGVTIQAVRAWATEALSTHVSGELLLLGDEEIGLEAAFPGAPGILLIAGTGSHAIARASDGTLHRAGGWGPVLGDEGGGYWIGLEAIRTALRAHDSQHNAAQAILHAIQAHWSLTSLPELIELGNRRSDAAHPPPDFASLAPVIARCAAEGNSLAAEILHRAGEQLAHLANVVATKAAASISATAPPPCNKEELSIAFTGSVLEQIPAVRASLAQALARTLPVAQLSETSADPLQGALYRARNG